MEFVIQAKEDNSLDLKLKSKLIPTVRSNMYALDLPEAVHLSPNNLRGV